MPETMQFPTLYKLADNGAIIEWNIEVERLGGPGVCVDHGIVVTSWGQQGGARQQTRDAIKEGKNLGKKNETTPYQQACAEAQSKWTKQQTAKKYVASEAAARSGERDVAFVAGGWDCMLAWAIEKRPNALVFPCAIQRKYDGHRMLADIVDGICTLWTRSRKQITSMPHIARALAERFRTGHHRLDGEGYCHELTFEEVSSLLRCPEPQPGHEQVGYHIYDTFQEGVPYIERLKYLWSSLDRCQHPLYLAETVVVETEQGMNSLFEQFLEAGYEGAMARNLAGLYVGKRSADLLKLKKFQDAEYECVRVEVDMRTVSDSGGTREVAYPVFVCKLDGWTGDYDEDHEFNTPMMGGHEAVRVFVDRPSLAIGRKLTVKFQDLTKDNKPRFPKARLYQPL